VLHVRVFYFTGETPINASNNTTRPKWENGAHTNPRSATYVRVKA
jgi:hypothetical protein